MADQRGLRLTFDSDADLYQQARPEYPEQLYEAVITAAGLGAADRLLEIGRASGKATLPLARRGFSHHVRRAWAGAGRRNLRAAHVFPKDGGPFFTDPQQVYDEIGEGLPEKATCPQPGELPDEREDKGHRGQRTIRTSLGAALRLEVAYGPHRDGAVAAAAPVLGDPAPIGRAN